MLLGMVSGAWLLPVYFNAVDKQVIYEQYRLNKIRYLKWITNDLPMNVSNDAIISAEGNESISSFLRDSERIRRRRPPPRAALSCRKSFKTEWTKIKVGLKASVLDSSSMVFAYVCRLCRASRSVEFVTPVSLICAWAAGDDALQHPAPRKKEKKTKGIINYLCLAWGCHYCCWFGLQKERSYECICRRLVLGKSHCWCNKECFLGLPPRRCILLHVGIWKKRTSKPQ